MREEFLQYLWKFMKFDFQRAVTTDGERLEILHPGTQNEHSGPDFFNSKVRIGDQLWAGNIEIHLKSSYWYLHHHETDENYDNVILHVVWEDDADVFSKNDRKIATLELRKLIPEDLLKQYQELLERDHLKLNCETSFSEFDEFLTSRWLERLYFERLERRSSEIFELLKSKANDWESVFFIHLARAFGLNVNGVAFENMASNIDFQVVRKLRRDCTALEALFLGYSNLITSEDHYATQLQKKYDWIAHKFQIDNSSAIKPNFFRLRPDNFPTLRLAQLASFLSKNQNFFNLISAKLSLPEIRKSFEFDLNEYWNIHYNFGKSHAYRKKHLSKAFVDLLLINCIIPLKYCYSKFKGEENFTDILELLQQLKPEKNSKVTVFEDLKPGIARSAFQSQALIELKNRYCDVNRCLQCELGSSLFKKVPK